MAVIIDQSGAIPVPVTPKNDDSILRAVRGNISLDDVKDSKGRYAVSAVDFSHLSRVNLSTPQIASPSVVTFNGMPKQVTQVIHNNAGNGQLNVAPAGGVTSNLPHANQSTQTLQVILNNSGNGQLNVNPTGGVTSNLPQANHDPTVLLSSVTGNQRNLIPDSGLKNVKAYWTDHSGGLITITQNIDGSTNCFQYTGTGAASGFQYQSSKIITVTPGTYTLSAEGWVSNITSGSMFVGVYDTTRVTQYGYLFLTGSRASAQITIPAGVSQVVVIFDTDNATVTNGQGAGVQNMQFEPGSVMTAYRENTGDNLSGTLLIDTGNSNHIGNWQHSYMSTGVKGVISSGSQVNVNPSGGVTGNLPYANHDVSVRTTLASTVGADGSYLNTSQVFNRHLNSATQSGLADDATYIRWKQTQQTALLTNPGANHITDPTFTSVADFWGNVNSASAGVLNQGTVAASGYSTNNNYDGRGNQVKVPLQPNDILVLQLTSTQARTSTATTYITADFQQSNGTHISYANNAYVPGSGTGTGTSVTTAPANTAYAYIFIQTAGGASGGNAALVTNPQARINHETVADVSAKKAYIDANDQTSGGHVNLSKYASLVGLPDGIQVSATPVLDGGTVTFATPFTGNTAPEVLWLDGGVTYDSTITGSQYQLFSETMTGSAGNWTGFTASLKISALSAAVTNENLSFSSDSVTISVPAGDSVVGPGSFSVTGTVKNTGQEYDIITITVTDTTHTLSWQKSVGVASLGTKPFNINFTDTSAANGTVFTVGYSSGGSDFGNPVINYQVQGTVTVHSATPTGAPGVNWIAFATS